MANTIKFKRASGSDPSASDLAIGEPALRTDTAELFFKKDDGTVGKVAGGGGGTGGGQEKIFFESENEMNSSYTISTNHNALVAGPLTIASGATLTINSPSVVTIP